ncbi:caspase family protein [Brachyspira innocens]|uniref:caspase family protein n=1 Tax=Brachyspira innocens TaxID=13264 RepID=UPI000378C4A1|nr:caspase family protein [Brachyspira innocens]
MERLAILISDFGEENDIMYTKEDIKNFRFFLQSNIGGAWRNDEIVCLCNPNKSKIEKLSNIECDYTITMVSSHGGVSKEDGQLYLYINNMMYKDISFKNQSKKQLIIFDCCRSYIPEEEYFSEKVIRESTESSEIMISDLYRNKYNDHIKKSDDGIIVLYSCQIDQASDGRNETGSYFINSLIEASKIGLRSKYIVTVKDALYLSKECIQKYPTNQVPEINAMKRNVYFPIAVRL